jgi:hypothetical protein
MLNRKRLATRYRLIPGLVAGTLYRLGVDDEVQQSQAVQRMRYKENGVQEVPSNIGPTRTETFTIHLYDEELCGWVVEENDIIHINDTATNTDRWVRVDQVSRQLMQTRFACQCTPSVPR